MQPISSVMPAASSHLTALNRLDQTGQSFTDIYAYDSANHFGIPSNAEAVLPYGDGRFAWSNTLFPHARYRYFTVTGDHTKGSIVDFEPGLVNDTQTLIDFVDARNDAHDDAAVYTFRYEFDNVVAHALEGRKYDLIIATLDGTKLTSYHGKPLKGCQFYNQPAQQYDLSIIWDRNWLHPGN